MSRYGSGFLPDQQKNVYEIVDFCMANLWSLEPRKHRSEYRNRQLTPTGDDPMCRSVAQLQIAAENGHLEVGAENLLDPTQDPKLVKASGHLYRKLRNAEFQKIMKFIENKKHWGLCRPFGSIL